MKLSSHCLKILLLLINALFSSGCISQQASEHVAIVIFNDTPEIIKYQIALSGKLTQPVKINANEFDYVYEYDEVGKSSLLPEELSKVILLTNKCKIVLDQNKMKESFSIDPDGRNTWDLHVTSDFLKKTECK